MVNAADPECMSGVYGLLRPGGLSAVTAVQAAALVKNKEVGSRNIPYCCLTECIREDQRQWRWHFGVLLQQDFLTHAESAEEAQRQRQLWGLENGSS